MKVVRIAMPGTRSRSFPRSSSVSARVVWRRIADSIESLACWSGMSMYLTMLSSLAIASIDASSNFDGYAYIRRIQPPPNSRATPSIVLRRPGRPPS